MFSSQEIYPPLNYLSTEEAIIILKARHKNDLWSICGCFSPSHLFVRRH